MSKSYSVVIPTVRDRLEPLPEGATQALLNEGRCRVPFESARLVQMLVRLFFLLTEMPQNYQNLWSFDEDANGEADTGLLRRQGEKKDPRFITPEEIAQSRVYYDANKWCLHYKWNLEGLLKALGVELPPEMVELLNYCQAMSTACLHLGYQIGRALDQLLPGFYFYYRLRCNEGFNNLRLLRYKAGVKIEAREHTDKSGLTIHIGSFPPALRIRPGASKAGDESHPLVDAEESALDDAIVFLGDQAVELATMMKSRSDDPDFIKRCIKVQALYHVVMDRRSEPRGGDVRRTAEALHEGDRRWIEQDRWTVVAFLKLAPPRYIPVFDYPPPPSAL